MLLLCGVRMMLRQRSMPHTHTLHSLQTLVRVALRCRLQTFCRQSVLFALFCAFYLVPSGPLISGASRNTSVITSMGHRINWIFLCSFYFYFLLKWRFVISYFLTNERWCPHNVPASQNSIDFSKQFARCKCAVLYIYDYRATMGVIVVCFSRCDLDVATGCYRYMYGFSE